MFEVRSEREVWTLGREPRRGYRTKMSREGTTYRRRGRGRSRERARLSSLRRQRAITGVIPMDKGASRRAREGRNRGGHENGSSHSRNRYLECADSSENERKNRERERERERTPFFLFDQSVHVCVLICIYISLFPMSRLRSVSLLRRSRHYSRLSLKPRTTMVKCG